MGVGPWTTPAAPGGGLGQLREHNRAVVLRALLDHGRLSRTQLVELSGLPQSVVSAITAELLATGLLDGSADRQGHAPDAAGQSAVVARRGRQALPLDLAPRSRVAAAIHIGATNADVGLVDLRAVPLAHRRLRLDRDTWAASAETLVRHLAAQVRELVATAGLPASAVLGLGVGVAGWVDGEQGVVRRHPRLGWHDAALAEPLSRELGLPVALDEHVRCMALGEAWFGSGRAADSLALLYVNTLVGCGVVIQRRVHRGLADAAGAVGFLPAWPVADGSALDSGARLPRPAGGAEPYEDAEGAARSLEATVAEPALRQEALVVAVSSPTSLAAAWARRSVPGHFHASDELAGEVAAAASPDAPTLALLRRRAARLAPFVAQLLGSLAPEVFTIAGPLAQDPHRLQIHLLREAVLAHAPGLAGHLPPFVPSAFGMDGVLVGAASLVLQQVYSPPLVGTGTRVRDGAAGDAVRRRVMGAMGEATALHTLHASQAAREMTEVRTR